MTARTYSRLAGAIFAIVALLHLARALEGAEATLGGVTIPIAASWIGALIAGALAGFGFTARRD
jgi:hypothetical protein